MIPRSAQVIRQSSFGLTLGGLFLLVPKCVLCLGAYAAMGGWIGLKFSGREICSATSSWTLDPKLGAVILFATSAVWIFREIVTSWIVSLTKLISASLSSKVRERYDHNERTLTRR
ncbi:MAG TPA: hypothetical protein VIM69_05060 [Opitutaceae bacterium]